MTRRNLPPINPNGTRFRDVRIEPEAGYYYAGSKARSSGVSLQWRRVMAIVWRYQAAGFRIEYSERRDADGYRVADIDIQP